MTFSNSNKTSQKTSIIIRIIHYLISFDITPVTRPNQTYVSAQYADESASKQMGQMT